MTTKTKRAVVVGGGTMGSGIALVSAAGGWEVDLAPGAARLAGGTGAAAAGDR